MKHKKHDKKRKASSNPLKPHRQSKVSKPGQRNNKKNGAKPSAKPHPNLNSKPIVPFTPTSNLLLVGEGDFSFTHSLIKTPHVAPSTILTTSTNESEAITLEKYPQSEDTLNAIREAKHRLFFNVDVTKSYPKGIRTRTYDAIIFNFPHTGGLTTAVDRQIRANQELLLAFLKNSVPLLSTAGGTIVVTLFEGLPYSNWNLRELAKSVGLQCQRSFKFDAGMYVGYKHMRTIGTRDRAGDWKGEERGARTYIFEVIGKRRKRGRGKDEIKKKGKEESSDEDEDDYGEGNGESDEGGEAEADVEDDQDDNKGGGNDDAEQ
ncbi:hypothetical protein ABW20_dc0104318 [Dactylellina cionopaga]|nr:hypothetical protein ABW20_dc0104318 [Dactylellina cionopaga]